MRKVFSVLLVAIVLMLNPIAYSSFYASAETENETTSIEVEIEKSVEDQLSSLDTLALEELFKSISNTKEIFVSEDFNQTIKNVITGKINVNTTSFFNYSARLFLDDVIRYLPYVCLILAMAVLYSMVSSTSVGNKSIGDMVHFVCFGAIVVICVSCITHLVGITTECVASVKSQMDVVFPILLTLVTALGGNVSVSMFQPSMVALSNLAITIFSNILLPLFTFKIIFTIISNITNGIKFNKFSEFFGSCFKWLLGAIITIFTAFMSVSGLMSGFVDGISLKTAKYTIKSGIPIIGGFLSDGVSVMMLSCSLIKNAIGVSGLVLLFCSIIIPVIKIVVFSLLLKLVSAILEPIADSRVTSFVGDIAKSISTLIAIILGVAFMYFIVVGLVMCIVNFG